MSLQNLSEILALRLKSPLPGPDAQLSLLNDEAKTKYKERLDQHFKSNTLEDARRSSVMILLYEKNGDIYFPLILRPTYEGVHSGQIALPGGKRDPEDVDLFDTALREVHEEIGIEKQHISILGTLTQVYIPPSHFLVDVVVAAASGELNFNIDNNEVEALIEMPLSAIHELPVEERHVGHASSWKMIAPGYVHQGHFIWGATAMMLAEFKEIIKS